MTTLTTLTPDFVPLISHQTMQSVIQDVINDVTHFENHSSKQIKLEKAVEFYELLKSLNPNKMYRHIQFGTGATDHWRKDFVDVLDDRLLYAFNNCIGYELLECIGFLTNNGRPIHNIVGFNSDSYEERELAMKLFVRNFVLIAIRPDGEYFCDVIGNARRIRMQYLREVIEDLRPALIS